MFLRMTTWKANDQATMRSVVESKREQIASVPGMTSCHVAWNADGSGVTFALYESEAAAVASTEQIQAIWSDLASLLAAPPETATYSESMDIR